MDRPQYVNWIVREDGVVFEDQQPLNCYRLSYVRDDAILSLSCITFVQVSLEVYSMTAIPLLSINLRRIC